MLVLFALTLTVLFGALALAVDGGIMYMQRRVMQNAADAAALAGASYLADAWDGGGVGASGAAVYDVASAYQRANAPRLPDAALKLEYVDAAGAVLAAHPAAPPGNSRGVRATATSQSESAFAQVLGVSFLRASAQATAAFGPPRQGTGVLPIAVDDELDASYQLQPAGGVGGGNFVNVSILNTAGFGSRQDVLAALRDGMRDALVLGQQYPTNVPDFIRWRRTVVDVLQQRIRDGRARGDTPTSFTADSPQLLIVPTVRGGFPNAPEPVLLYRFRAFFLQEVDPNGNWARGIFVRAPLDRGTIDPRAPFGGVTLTRLVA